MKHRLLWRVRRKLILSYIFIGVVPSLLIVHLFLLGGVLIFMKVIAYRSGRIRQHTSTI